MKELNFVTDDGDNVDISFDPKLRYGVVVVVHVDDTAHSYSYVADSLKSVVAMYMAERERISAAAQTK